MSEKYNKYSQSLYLCGCKGAEKKPAPQPKNCCEGLKSKNNTIEILIRQLKREVAELMQTTRAKLLCQDKKIAQVETYIKNNLSNYLRELIDSMELSGELDEIIKSVITDTLIDIEADVETLKAEVTQLKSNTTANSVNIDKLQNEKTNFTKYEDFEINSKFKNIEIEHEYYEGTEIYITKLKNVKAFACMPTNGDPAEDTETGKKSIMELAQSNNKYDVYTNCGMNGTYIFNGIINTTHRLDCPMYCGFDENNNMSFYNGLADTIDPVDLLSQGIINLFPGFTPIIVGHELFDLTEITDLASTNEIAQKFADSINVKHPRQLIAQDDDNNFTIFSVMGRYNNCSGLNYPEMQAYFQNKNYKNVFNCDGGGSTQTIYNKNYVFYPSLELDTNIDRKVPSALGFQLEEVE